MEDGQFLHFGPKLDQSLALKPPNLYFIRQSYGSPLDCFRKIPSRIKHLEFLGLLFYSWKFQAKQSFTPGNSAKLCCTHWKFQGQNARPMGIPHYFCLMTPGNSCSPYFRFTWSHSNQSSRSNFLCYGIFLGIYGNLLLVCHSYQFMGLLRSNFKKSLFSVHKEFFTEVFL